VVIGAAQCPAIGIATQQTMVQEVVRIHGSVEKENPDQSHIRDVHFSSGTVFGRVQRSVAPQPTRHQQKKPEKVKKSPTKSRKFGRKQFRVLKHRHAD
jgi:hypothetical protein